MTTPETADRTEAAPQISSRFRSLDGLRGIAALVVVTYHIALTSAVVAEAYLHPKNAELSPVASILFDTPLHIVWAGREAVIVFFVLSGFVLALPTAEGRSTQWRSYYPRRLIRLYLPAIASLVFAFATTLLVPRTTLPGASEWLNQHAQAPNGIKQVILGSTLMGGSGGLNTPLWSLRWEVLFSLLLPAYLFIAARARKYSLLAGGIMLVLEAVGSATGILGGAFTYLPAFAVGVFMAFNLPRLKAFVAQLSASARWWPILAVAWLLLTSQWTIGQHLPDPDAFRAVSIPLNSAGAALLLFLAAWWRPAAKLLERPAIRWLGRVSFSLYLTHEPVVIAVSHALGARAPLWQTYAIAAPIALLLAEVFYRMVEAPSLRLSKSVGRKLSR